MRKPLIVIILIAVVLGVGVTALTLHNISSKDSGMDMSGMDTSQTTTKALSATNAVTIQNFAFSPAKITVKKGTTVTWTNKDSAAHTITEDHGGSADGDPGMDSKLLSQGESYQATFSKVGTYTYHCTVHPSMTGTVIVTD
jgi:plastocyanin